MQGDKERLEEHLDRQQQEIARLQAALDTAAKEAYERGYEHGYDDGMTRARGVVAYPAGLEGA